MTNFSLAPTAIHVWLDKFKNVLNRMSRRKRGIASNPLFIIPDFFCIFQTNLLAMATLGLKEREKFLWEGREKGLPCWLSQFSFADFPISIKPKVAIANFVWKMQ